AHEDPSLTALRRLLQQHGGRWTSRRHRTKRALHLCQYLIGSEISGKYKSGVVWMIVTAVIGLLLLNCGALYILKPSYDRIPIRMDLERRGFLFLQQQSPRRVEAGLQFFDYDFVLGFKLLGIKST